MKDDAAAADQAVAAKLAVSVTSARDGGLIQTSSGCRQQRVDRVHCLDGFPGPAHKLALGVRRFYSLAVVPPIGPHKFDTALAMSVVVPVQKIYNP